MGEITIFLGGQAGEGIKRGALTIGKLLNLYGYHVFIMDDYVSTIRGGQDYSEVHASQQEVFSQSGSEDIIFSFHQDVYERYKDKLKENGIVVLDEEDGLNVPFNKILKEHKGIPVMKPSIVLGVISYITDIPFSLVEKVLKSEFKEKGQKNIELAQYGFNFAEEKNFPKISLSSGVKPPYPIVSGNELIALGAVHSGMKIYTAYPITPASSVLHFLAKESKRLHIAAVHTEDEISAIMMAIGAAYAGVPAMVGTSGPGIDLMSEAISLAGGTEIPVVILDSQRAGPTTGVPTYTEQSDLNEVLHTGHGEFPRIVLAPGSIDECFELTVKAFQYAWWYQTPVFILSDKHISESSKTVNIPFDKQFKLSAKYFQGDGEYKRYLDTDDGISPFAIPGIKGVVNHTNSTEHTEEGYSSGLPHNVVKMKNKRIKKQNTINRDFLSEHTINMYGNAGAKNLIVSFGSPKGAILEAIQDLPVKCMQIIVADPFPWEKVKNIFDTVTNIIDVEQNSTAQLARLVKEKTGIEIKNKILRYDGRPFDPFELREKIEEALK